MPQMSDKKVSRVAAFIALAIILIFIAINSFTIIPTGYTGVKTTFRQVSSEVVPSGITFKIPFVQRIKKVNNKQQTIMFSDKVWGESTERTVVYMENVALNYRINPEYSAWLYSNVTDYKENALPSALVQSALKGAMKELNANDVTNRSKIEPIAADKIQQALDEKYSGNRVINIVSVNVYNMDFEAAYNTAIELKQLAAMNYEQQQITNKTAVEMAEAEAEKTKIAAEAEAEKIRIAANAEAETIIAVAEAKAEANRKLQESLSDTIIEYQKIEKWDGKLPVAQGATPIIDIPIN